MEKPDRINPTKLPTDYMSGDEVLRTFYNQGWYKDRDYILMGMIGTIGNMALIRTEPDFAIKNVALIKDTKQINYLYLYHFLHSPFVEKQLSSGMDGGTQKFVSLGSVRNLDIFYI